MEYHKLVVNATKNQHIFNTKTIWDYMGLTRISHGTFTLIGYKRGEDEKPDVRQAVFARKSGIVRKGW